MRKCRACGCEPKFKMFQSNFDEDNEFSPSYIQNRPKIEGFLTDDKLTEILQEYLRIEDFDKFRDEIIRVVGDPGNYTNIAITLLGDLDFRYGVNNVTSLVNMPVTKQSVVARLTGNDTLSLGAAMKPGQVINIKVEALTALKVVLPASTGWTLMDESEIELDAQQVAEINVWCTGVNEYSVKTVVLQ